MSERILVTRRPPGRALDMLHEVGTVDLWEIDGVIPRTDLLRRVAAADALYCMLTDQVDRTLLEAAPENRIPTFSL